MITPTINQKIAEALRAHEMVRLNTLRMLSSAFNYEKIAKQHDLSEEEEIAVVRREAKIRKEAIEAYEKAGVNDKEKADEKAAKEREELRILEEFLPKEMPEEEVLKIIDSAILETKAVAISDMGKVIGIVKAKTKGSVDGGKIAALVKTKLAV